MNAVWVGSVGKAFGARIVSGFRCVTLRVMPSLAPRPPPLAPDVFVFPPAGRLLRLYDLVTFKNTFKRTFLLPGDRLKVAPAPLSRFCSCQFDIVFCLV